MKIYILFIFILIGCRKEIIAVNNDVEFHSDKVFNVMSYTALGDSSDNSEAIQRAIADYCFGSTLMWKEFYLTHPIWQLEYKRINK